VVGTDFEVIVWDKVYAHAHIDSTLMPLKKDLILVNGARINTADRLPKFLRSYRKIWVNEMYERSFHQFPYASKWIGMNVLPINQDTLMIDPRQKELIKQIGNEMKIVAVELRHSRTLGGGHHCVTCDLERE
jgi:glycine amidinotransferase/scyllo-inosamine-4-phosphate amidinotransferase 1